MSRTGDSSCVQSTVLASVLGAEVRDHCVDGSVQYGPVAALRNSEKNKTCKRLTSISKRHYESLVSGSGSRD